jgi:hypothetical protein
MFAVLLVAVAVNQLLTLRSPAAPTARADDPVATDEPVAER